MKQIRMTDGRYKTTVKRGGVIRIDVVTDCPKQGIELALRQLAEVLGVAYE